MFKMRSLSVTLAVTILLVGLLGTCQSVNLNDFKEAYGVKTFLRETGVYINYDKTVANGFTGEFELNGKTYTLPVMSIEINLYTNKTRPFWLRKSSMTVNVHFYGGPIKVSTLLENCSKTVQYLGDKFDPSCQNLNCQRYMAFPVNAVYKRELVDPNGWGAFQVFSVPIPKGVENKKSKTLDRDLMCNNRLVFG